MELRAVPAVEVVGITQEQLAAVPEHLVKAMLAVQTLIQQQDHILLVVAEVLAQQVRMQFPIVLLALVELE
jgi:hypothetical protein